MAKHWPPISPEDAKKVYDQMIEDDLLTLASKEKLRKWRDLCKVEDRKGLREFGWSPTNKAIELAAAKLGLTYEDLGGRDGGAMYFFGEALALILEYHDLA